MCLLTFKYRNCMACILIFSLIFRLIWHLISVKTKNDLFHMIWLWLVIMSTDEASYSLKKHNKITVLASGHQTFLFFTIVCLVAKM